MNCFGATGFHYSRVGKEAEIRIKLTSKNKQYCVGYGQGGLITGSYRQTKHNFVTPPQNEGQRACFNGFQFTKSNREFSILSIGASRDLPYQQVQGMQKDPDYRGNANHYVDSSLDRRYAHKTTGLKQWLINRYVIIDKDWATGEKRNWDALLEGLPLIGPSDSNFHYCRTERDLEPIFSVYAEECYLAELSAGFQAILTVIIEIFSWIESSRGSKTVPIERQLTWPT